MPKRRRCRCGFDCLGHARAPKYLLTKSYSSPVWPACVGSGWITDTPVVNARPTISEESGAFLGPSPGVGAHPGLTSRGFDCYIKTIGERSKMRGEPSAVGRISGNIRMGHAIGPNDLLKTKRLAQYKDMLNTKT
jgi:hypothetical protein